MNKTNHLLFTIAEEAGEVAQLAGKCGRFGLEDSHPKTGDVPNLTLLIGEINDLLGAVEMLVEGLPYAPMSYVGDREQINAKKLRIVEYMEYARERNQLDEEA